MAGKDVLQDRHHIANDGEESWGMFLQQLAAVVTAVRCVPVAKKSRNCRHAVKPPSRTMEPGKSTDIFESVWICASGSPIPEDTWHRLTLKACSATSMD